MIHFGGDVVRIEVQQEPAFACLRCWKLKKKCDRVSPKCSRCDLMNVSCAYSDQPPTERSQSLRSRVPDAVSLYAPPSTVHNADKRRAPPSTPSSTVSSSTTSELSAGHGLLLVLKTRQVFDDFISAQLHDTFNALRHELKSTCDHYLESFNTSLPIIIEAELRNHLTNFDRVIDTEIRLLLLSIYLVTKTPGRLPHGGTDVDSLYSFIKPLYADFTSTRSPSIPVIQVGFLIAIYEQGQGLHEAAYLTIGVCARMGQAIGLHKSLKEDLPSDRVARNRLETHKHVWWILICLDRILVLESRALDRPLAANHPTLDDHLPSFYGTDVENCLPVGKMRNNNSELPEIAFTPANSFARTCQATYLLSLVFIHIGNETYDQSARHIEATYLDETLRAFSLYIIEQSNQEVGVPWNYSCAAYMICMIALSALHHHNLFLDICSSFATQPVQHFARTSRLALQFISRVAIDGARTKLDDLVEGARNAPPFTLNFFREMAVFVLRMGHEEGKTMKQMVSEISSIRTYLSRSSEKWKLAGRHLAEIDDIAAKFEKDAGSQ